MTEITGGCRCGQLRYRFDQSGPLVNYCCHCLDCQKTTGSAFADQVMVDAAAFSMTGEQTHFIAARPSGGQTTHMICPQCHGRIGSYNSEYTALILVRGGTLDDPAPLDPFMHIWTKRKRDWIGIAAGIPCFEEAPAPAEFFRLATARRDAAG